MIILIKLFLNSKLDLIPTIKFVKLLFRIQIKKGGKVWDYLRQNGCPRFLSNQASARSSR